MRASFRLLALAVVAPLAASCKSGTSAFQLPADKEVHVTVRCSPDSTYIAVIPAMAAISLKKGEIEWVLDASSTIDSISVVAVDSTPFNSSSPIKGKKGSNGKGTLKSNAAKDNRYKYQIIGECRVGTEPVKQLVIDPEVIIVDQ